MFNSNLLLLIFVSIFIGFLLGRWLFFYKKKRDLSSKEGFSKEYFVGLNYLLNEQTDEAIDTFIKALELSSDNIETYIVIGRLFRRRGEIQKAIQAHQDILARPSLTREQSLQVQLELAHDYLKAGLLDRAEALLIDLSSTDWQNSSEAVESLLSVYEQEKEWKKAIQIMDGLPFLSTKLSVKASHYYAELASIYIKKKDFMNARQFTCKAMMLDRQGVRSILQMGLLEYTLGNYREAIKYLQKIVHKNPVFVTESICLLEKCYDKLPSKRSFTTYLSYCLKHYPTMAVVKVAARQISLSQNEAEASRFVESKINERPSLKGLDFLIDYLLHDASDNELQRLNLLKNIVKKLLTGRPEYLCSNCGFKGEELHWRCPRCHVWGMIEPIIGLEGE